MSIKSICFVMPFHIMEERGGGAEVQAWLLAKALARRGYSVSYISQSVKGKHGQKEILDCVTIHWIKYANHFQWLNGPKYYEILRHLNPDVVVQRTTSFISGVAGYYCKKYTKKFVWICTDNASPTKWFFSKKQLQKNKKEMVNPLKASVFLINSFIYDLSRHAGMKRVDYPFTQNEEQRQLLKIEYKLDSFRMISGQELPGEQSVSFEEKLANKIVLWVGHLGPVKRPEKFIELARQAEDSDLRFIMIGSKDNNEYLKTLVGNLPGNLEWLGQLPFQETLAWFDRAAFFVNTSTSEGFPNTYIQAWLRGVPVLSLGADPDDVIKKNSLGFIGKDVNELYNIIDTFWDCEDKYGEISERVKSYSRLHHSVDNMTSKFLEVILSD